MKRVVLSISLFISVIHFSLGQTVSSNSCITPGTGGGSGNGNVVIFANYDGGVLNINVDQNIPNLKIGVCTYEPVTINVTGPFASNVTEVRYAGYVSTNNNHCTNSPTTTTINAPGSAVTSVNFLPPATLSNPNGYSMIVCGYTCSTTSNQGGCNTRDQIEDYFTTTMNGTLFSYYTQYGCWSTTPYNVSFGTNCTGTPADTTTSSFSSSSISVCIGDSINFTDMSPNAVSWSWSAPGSSVPTANTQDLSNVMYVTPGTYNVTLTVNDGSGTCSTMQTIAVSNTLNMTVTANPTNICPGDTSTIQASGASNYTWSNGPVTASQQVNPSTSTWYYVTGTNNGACSKTDSVIVTVFAGPIIPNLTYVSGQLQVTPTGFTYQWYLDGNLIIGATGSSYTPTQNGLYSVTYVDGNGCQSAEDVIIVNDQNNSSIEEYGEQLKLYPNPGNGIFYLDLPQLQNQSVRIEVMDAVGKVILNKTVTVNQTVSLDLTGNAKGIYQTRIHTDKKVLTGKLIIE